MSNTKARSLSRCSTDSRISMSCSCWPPEANEKADEGDQAAKQRVVIAEPSANPQEEEAEPDRPTITFNEAGCHDYGGWECSNAEPPRAGPGGT